jgi:glycosyltransferase involved in cell wall biosynthesis
VPNLVSVIIPCYNGEKFIERSIRSVMEQDYRDIELIVVDDGSTDRSKEIILGLKTEFDNENRELKYVYQENTGVGGAVSTALKYVSGDYLTLLDADDRFCKDSIGKRAGYLSSHTDFAGVRSNGRCISGDRSWLFINDPETEIREDIFGQLIEGTTNNWSGTYMVRTDILFDIYPDRNIYCSRYGQNLQILCPVAYGRKIGYVDEVLVEYIIRNSSLTHHSEALSQKALENAKGFYDIRYHIIDLIFDSANTPQAQQYYRLADLSYFRMQMQIAISDEQKDQAKKVYRKIILSGGNINDSITYYCFAFKPVSYLLRVWRKIKNKY